MKLFTILMLSLGLVLCENSTRLLTDTGRIVRSPVGNRLPSDTASQRKKEMWRLQLEKENKEALQTRLWTPSKDRVVCFYTHDACERGVDVAIFDYADYTETLLGHSVKYVIPDIEQARKGLGLPKILKRFGNNTHFFKPDMVSCGQNKPMLMTGPSFPSEARRIGCDYVYIQKAGGRFSHPCYPLTFNATKVRAGVHAVFSWQNHGPLVPYAAIGADVTQGKPGREIVPYMVRSPSLEYASMAGLRGKLGIPQKALVICRHGGKDTFDVPFVHSTIHSLLEKYSDGRLHFVFLNTKPFGASRPAIHHLPGTYEMAEKEQFFKTCDAMLHGRREGETFGLAVAEFSIHNIPVITYPGDAKEHVRILGDKGLVYNSEGELRAILEKLIAEGVDRSRDWNAYKDYEPRPVMAKFKKAFLDPVFGP